MVIYLGVERIADLLIKNGIKVNHMDTDRKTALHEAAWAGKHYINSEQLREFHFHT